MSIRPEIVRLGRETVRAIVDDVGEYVSPEVRERAGEGYLQVLIMLPGDTFLGIDGDATAEKIEEDFIKSSTPRLLSLTHLGTKLCFKDEEGVCWCWVRKPGGWEKVRVPCELL